MLLYSGRNCWGRVGQCPALLCAKLLGPALTQAEPRVGADFPGTHASVTFKWKVQHLLHWLETFPRETTWFHPWSESHSLAPHQKWMLLWSRQGCSVLEYIHWRSRSLLQKHISVFSLRERKIEQFNIHSKHSMNVSYYYYQILSHKSPLHLRWKRTFYSTLLITSKNIY